MWVAQPAQNLGTVKSARTEFIIRANVMSKTLDFRERIT